MLRDALMRSAKSVFPIMKRWDVDGDGTIGRKEFRLAIRMMGFEFFVKDDEIDKLFDSFDVDRSEKITYNELHSQLTKHEAGMAQSELRRNFLRGLLPASIKRNRSGDAAESPSPNEGSRKKSVADQLTQLCAACVRGDEDEVSEVIESMEKLHLDPHAGGADGGTALMRAAANGHISLTERLITHGAYLHAIDDEGLTALSHASIGGHKRTCTLLLTHGASLLSCFATGEVTLMLNALDR